MSQLEDVPAATMDEIFAETFGKRLTSVGFTFIKRTKWTRVRTPGFRDLFEIMLGKGHVYYPSWGFSLDFVPHVSGSTVRWHRTDKSSLLDLRDRQWPSAKGVWKLIGPDRARRPRCGVLPGRGPGPSPGSPDQAR